MRVPPFILLSGFVFATAAQADGTETAAKPPATQSDWQAELKVLMESEHDCVVSDITHVAFTSPDGSLQIFATVDCENTRSFSVSRIGDRPFTVNR